MTRFPHLCLALALALIYTLSVRADIVIDDYTNTGDGNTVVSGAIVDLSDPFFISANADHYGFSALTSPITEYVEYDFGATTLGALGGGSVNILHFGAWVPDADFDDWTLKVSLFDGGTEHVAHNGSFVNQVNTYSASLQAADADRIRFSFTFNTGGVIGSSSGKFGDFSAGGGSPDGSVLFANPEPTTMMMFGSVVGLSLLVRRRRA